VITVVIIDDQPLVRAGLRALLDATQGMTVVAEAGDGYQGVSCVREHRPDVVLMDIQMPIMGGLDAIAAIRAEPTLIDTRVIVLTTFGLDEYVFQSLQRGADGYLLKDTPPERILDAIRVTNSGGSSLSAAVLRRLVDESTPWHARTTLTTPDLTPRERDILELLVTGSSNRQIAGTLGIGEATVKTYVSRLLTKFNVPSRVALVLAAHDHHLLPVRGPT
jgi:DNA-binding NarL/FixJ family response regulator